MDIRQEELGDLVDKEMAATSAAIEEAVRRIDVSALILRNCNKRNVALHNPASENCGVLPLYLGNDESGTKRYNRSKTGGQ